MENPNDTKRIQATNLTTLPIASAVAAIFLTADNNFRITPQISSASQKNPAEN
ncbi:MULTISPECIES: hypothetical protein [unclassified Microcoleus]|uniref:hypothetical protein n=1 Tax=unclassified Microcoleus TaxID=2642155 RepID=UPI002FCFAE0E